MVGPEVDALLPAVDEAFRDWDMMTYFCCPPSDGVVGVLGSDKRGVVGVTPDEPGCIT